MLCELLQIECADLGRTVEVEQVILHEPAVVLHDNRQYRSAGVVQNVLLEVCVRIYTSTFTGKKVIVGFK